MTIGAHVSVSGGLVNGIKNAEAIDAKCIQIFGASPRQWKANLRKEEDVKEFSEALKKSSVESVYLHGAYLPNLASLDPVIQAKSIANLGMHLKICEQIGGRGVIFHVGSGKALIEKSEAIKIAISGMKEVLKNTPGKSYLIMENSASHKKIGSTAKELGDLLKGVNSKRVKVCIDTAHLFEAGQIEKYDKENIKRFLDELDKEVGLENVVVWHINDSKTEFGSNHDRHENIGEGFLGKESFIALGKEKRIAHTDWILEVPGFDNQGPDKKNVDILNQILSG